MAEHEFMSYSSILYVRSISNDNMTYHSWSSSQNVHKLYVIIVKSVVSSVELDC